MNIGFDAKRAFHNSTGLGHYSRTLIGLLDQYFPQHQYYLFNPSKNSRFPVKGNSVHEVLPASFLARTFSAAWRSKWVVKDLQRLKVDLYHGLSHEIPIGIADSGIRSVVTIHDLIHERFPGQYNPVDVKIYSKKFRYACRHADKVIAISEQTKRDIIEFYNTPAEKIVVCYQSCNPAFHIRVSEERKAEVRKKYDLPAEFFLYVGSIIERKNLLNICKAMSILGNDPGIPLVVIGDGGSYKGKVKNYIREQGLEEKIIFLSERPVAKNDTDFHKPELFAAIYQCAAMMIYPSFFEGFGVPVLEALWSRIPVITSNLSCLPEAGGPGSYYVDPGSAEEIAAGMRALYYDKALVSRTIETGWQHAQLFAPDKYVSAVMKIYESAW